MSERLTQFTWKRQF